MDSGQILLLQYGIIDNRQLFSFAKWTGIAVHPAMPAHFSKENTENNSPIFNSNKIFFNSSYKGQLLHILAYTNVPIIHVFISVCIIVYGVLFIKNSLIPIKYHTTFF